MTGSTTVVQRERPVDGALSAAGWPPGSGSSGCANNLLKAQTTQHMREQSAPNREGV